MYSCKLNTKKVVTFTQAQGKKAGVLNSSGGPLDEKCNEYMKAHPEVTALHFTGINDAMIKEVWFTNLDEYVNIVKRTPFIIVSEIDEFPSVQPTGVVFEKEFGLSYFRLP